ncbi:MAG: metallophosphoesterase [Betaproteobacteria bacterium]
MRALLATLCFAIAVSAHAETWRFALIGDTPYNNYERRELPSMLENIAAEHPAFIIHIGDFKSSSWRCSDRLFLDRKSLFNTSTVPFIYVPGDNEWTDCKRLIAGHYDERERLAKLREVFFAEPFSLGKIRLRVEQQSASTPENLRWRLGPTLFISINVPGPDNNFGMSKEASPEFMERNPAILSWIRQGFALARHDHSAAIVIAMQGNPGFKTFMANMGYSGYRELLETLQRETADFDGQVLLLHGDTHWQRIDHPLRHPKTKESLNNFTRIESFGYPFMGWVKIIIDSEHPTLFRFETHPHNPKQ